MMSHSMTIWIERTGQKWKDLVSYCAAVLMIATYWGVGLEIVSIFVGIGSCIFRIALNPLPALRL
jgi:hypothetical protein